MKLQSKRKQITQRKRSVLCPEVEDLFLFAHCRKRENDLMRQLIERGELPYQGLLKSRPGQREQRNNVVLMVKLLYKLEGNTPVCQ